MKKLMKIGSVLAGLLMSRVAYAVIPVSPVETPKGAIPITAISDIIGNALSLVIIAAGLLTVGYLIWGGIEWLTSGGEKASYEAARNRITHAFLGLGIVLASYLIIKIFETLFNVSILGGFSFEPLYTPGK